MEKRGNADEDEDHSVVHRLDVDREEGIQDPSKGNKRQELIKKSLRENFIAFYYYESSTYVAN